MCSDASQNIIACMDWSAWQTIVTMVEQWKQKAQQSNGNFCQAPLSMLTPIGIHLKFGAGVQHTSDSKYSLEKRLIAIVRFLKRPKGWIRVSTTLKVSGMASAATPALGQISNSFHNTFRTYGITSKISVYFTSACRCQGVPSKAFVYLMHNINASSIYVGNKASLAQDAGRVDLMCWAASVSSSHRCQLQ